MLSPQEELEDDGSDEMQRQRRDECVRRAQLYGISSVKRLPAVATQPHDARTRRELQILVAPQQFVTNDGLSVYEDELEQRKHAVHRGIRPALDQSHPLQDLFTTIPRQLHGVNEQDSHTTSSIAIKHTREWRMGYRNDVQSESHGAVGMRGVFEPTDTMRERILYDTKSYDYGSTSTALAYPAPFTTPAQLAQRLEPFDAEQAKKEMEIKLHAGMLGESQSSSSPTKDHRGSSIQNKNKKKKTHWSPASHATLGRDRPPTNKRTSNQTTSPEQRFPLRQVESPLQKVALRTEPKHLLKQQLHTEQLNTSYAQIQQRAAQHHDPTVRYSLPIENPQYERAYRLGLDPVASSPSPSTSPQHERPESPDNHDKKAISKKTATSKPKSKPLLFRPKSAVSLHMTTAVGVSPSSSSPSLLLSRSASSASLLMSQTTHGKVAGAKRRPHSATVSYLGQSTVYVMEPPAPRAATTTTTAAAATTMNAHEMLQQQKQYGAQFLGVLLQERTRRQEIQRSTLQDLARRGVLHTIPMPQIFARLRREALKNLTTRAQHARYEKLPLEDYMSLCGMAVVEQRHEELRLDNDDDDDDDSSSSDEDENGDDRDENGELLARATEKQDGEDDQDDSPVIRALRDQAELRHLPFSEPMATTSLVFRKRNAALPVRADPVDGNNSSTIQAMRNALFVTREQFHIALEAFALRTRDVNLLFSALDVHVDDRVRVWEIICGVEWLQDGHEELRRSRVQVKARHLPKDLENLRQSVSIPHRTHVPLPLG